MSTNKVAVITGANKGLGFSIVKEISQKYEGKVYLTSRDELRGLSSCKELKALGLDPEYHQLDVTVNESVLRFIKTLSERKEQVDILVNNAGILLLKDAKEPKLNQAEQTIFVNFTSLVNFTEAILPMMCDGGNIVNISSSSGHLSRIPSDELREKISSEDLTLNELEVLMKSYLRAVERNEEGSEWGDSPYVVSKVAVNAYTFMLHRRLHLWKGISVNCVHPGYVISDMTRGGGSITPDEAAKLPAGLALRPQSSGQFLWHNGTVVPWSGPDPRGFIDGKL